ncbi:MAG: tellurite resistance TerB family protein [Fretibacterium sp.]|nr:tellurite resistance TerB family protein [Fretibacterium sp.]
MNVMDLLGAMMQSGGMASSSEQRVRQSMQQSGGGIQDALSGLLGGGGQSGRSSPAEGLLGWAQNAVGDRQNLAGMGVGALLGSLLGGGGKNSALGGIGGGLMGLLGVMAVKALSDAGQKTERMPAGLMAPKNAQEEQELQTGAELILMAMLNAAKADGQVDADELNRITGRMKEAGIGQDGLAYVVTQLQKPMDTETIIALVRGRPELAAQVYSASLMAIDVDTREEREYLDDLAARMGLSRQVAQNIEQLVGMQTA